MEEEEKEIDLRKIYNKLTVKDIVLIALAILLILMYIFHTQEIMNCNNYYQEIIENMTSPMSYLFTP